MKQMKRFAALLLTAVLALSLPLSTLAAGTIEVTEDVSVTDTYDWTRFKGKNITLNVYNWGEYISNGSDDSVDVVSAFQKLTGIHVNYTTFDSNESLYAKLRSGAADYDVIIPSDYMVAKMISEGMLAKPDYGNIPQLPEHRRGVPQRRLRPHQRVFGALYALHHRHHLQYHHGGQGSDQLGRPVG